VYFTDSGDIPHEGILLTQEGCRGGKKEGLKVFSSSLPSWISVYYLALKTISKSHFVPVETTAETKAHTAHGSQLLNLFGLKKLACL